MSIFQLADKKYIKNTEWVKEHSNGIESIHTCDRDDFQFLEDVLQNKRIVWLGENGHGVAEHSLLKSKLIDFLYHKMGFKVIAFESGLSECYSSNDLKDELSVAELMDKSIFSLWKTEETHSLFELIKKNEDLKLIGFDFQPSVKQSLFAAFLDKINVEFPSEFLQNTKKLEERASFWYQRIGSYKARRKNFLKIKRN